MSNILNHMSHMQAAATIKDIKDALREVGCDVSDRDCLGDLAGIIRKECLAGPILNATVEGGPGIRVVPVGKKGYKISSTSGATLEADLTDELPKGCTIHKALHNLYYHVIPAATKAAAAAPAIARLDLIKTEYDGIDFYENPAFGPNGQGRRSGLTPESWYIRVYTHQMKEPFYVNLGPMINDMRTEFMADVKRLMDKKIAVAFEKHIQNDHSCNHHHHPHHHHDCGGQCPSRPNIDPGFPVYPESEDIDPGFSVCPDCHMPMGEHCQHNCGGQCHNNCDHDCGHCHHSCHPDGCPNPTGPCARPTDSNNNGFCDICGWPSSEHAYHQPEINPNDLNGDGICDDCGLPLPQKKVKTKEEIELEKYLARK